MLTFMTIWSRSRDSIDEQAPDVFKRRCIVDEGVRYS